MPDKSKVFISYSRVDAKIAKAIADDLAASGVSVWMDQHSISVGERWSTAINTALEDSHAMVLVLSPDSMKSSNVEDEFTFFLDHNKPIVPVMVRDCTLHFQLNRLQWIDFRSGADSQRAFHDLIKSLYKAGVEFRQADEDALDSAQHSIIAGLMKEIDQERTSGQRRRRIMGGMAVLLVIAVLAIVGLLISSAVETDEPDETRIPTVEFLTGRVSGEGVDLFELPSRDSLVVFEDLPNGALLIVRERTADERFLLADFGPTSGFVLAENVNVTGIQQLALYISPTPQPTATPTPFITATPTVTPSPSPEVVLNPAADACLVSVADTANPQPVHLGPSAVRFLALDTVKPGESFVATGRDDEGWLFIGIGWVDRTRSGVTVENTAACDALSVDATLLPNRIRLFIKDLPLAQETATRDTIDTSAINDENALAVAEAWNNYGGLLENLEELINVEAQLLLAIIVPEATTPLTDDEERINIRFEADIFDELMPKERQADFDSFFFVNPDDPTQHQFRTVKENEFMDYHGDLALEWQAFQLAFDIDPEAALRSIRYSSTGLLGDQHAEIGYTTPQDMFDAFFASADARVIGTIDYVKSNTLLLGALRRADWERFGALFSERVGAERAATAQADLAIYQSLR